MEEKNIRKCKICSFLRERTLVGKFDDVNKKYKDEFGLTWNGNVCGKCHRMRAKETMRKGRYAKKHKVND